MADKPFIDPQNVRCPRCLHVQRARQDPFLTGPNRGYLQNCDQCGNDFFAEISFTWTSPPAEAGEEGR